MFIDSWSRQFWLLLSVQQRCKRLYRTTQVFIFQIPTQPLSVWIWNCADWVEVSTKTFGRCAWISRWGRLFGTTNFFHRVPIWYSSPAHEMFRMWIFPVCSLSRDSWVGAIGWSWLSTESSFQIINLFLTTARFCKYACAASQTPVSNSYVLLQGSRQEFSQNYNLCSFILDSILSSILLGTWGLL